MKLTSKQLRSIISNVVSEASNRKRPIGANRLAHFRLSDGTIKEINVVNNEASMVEDAPAASVSLETLKSVEQKFKEILHELPRDFGAMALVVSAAKAIVNARKHAESKPS